MQISKAEHIVLVISDLQCPFEHKDALAFCLAVKREYKPTTFVCIGDESDQCALSDYPSDPDGMNPGLELYNCIEHLRPWYKAFPKMSVCTSNHTDRIFKKAFNKGIPRGFLKSFREFLDAPDGWVWKDRFVYDDVLYEHGHGMGGGRTATYNFPLHARRSMVFGHFHSNAGIAYLSNELGQLHWGLNVGCLIDADKYAFQYGKKIKSKPVLGCGVIYLGIPFFIPMILDKHKRWIGKL